MPLWSSGEPIVLREIYDGRVWSVRPVRFVEDTGERIAVFLADGNRWLRPVTADGSPMRIQADGWRLRETAWAGNSTLRVWTPGKPHSVMLWWDPLSWEFLGWYVNFEKPMRPTAVGFDYLDLALDIVVRPDRTWTWKDEEEFEDAQARGILDASMAAAIRADAATVIADLEDGRWPFDDEWPSWRPDASWTPLGLPPDLGLDPDLRWDGPTHSP